MKNDNCRIFINTAVGRMTYWNRFECDSLALCKFNDKFYFEYLIEMYTLLNIKNITLLVYDYSEIPFLSQKATDEYNLLKKTIEEKYKNINIVKFNLKDFFNQNKAYTYENFYKILNVISKYNDDTVFWTDEILIMPDLEIIRKMIEFYQTKNYEFLHSNDARIHPFLIFNNVSSKKMVEKGNQNEFLNIGEFLLPDSEKYLINSKYFFEKYPVTGLKYFRSAFDSLSKNIISTVLNDMCLKEIRKPAGPKKVYDENIQLFSELPYHINIELTNACNQNCIFCPHSKMTRDKGEMKIEIIKKLLNEVVDSGKEGISIELSGCGEPVLHSEFSEILKLLNFYRNKIKINIDLYSNFSFDNDALIDSIINNKVDCVFVNLNSVDDEEYKSIHLTDKSVEIVKNNISKLIQKKMSHKNNESQYPVKPVITLQSMLYNDFRMDAYKKIMNYLPNFTKMSSGSTESIQNIFKELYKNPMVYDYFLIRGSADYNGTMKITKATDYTPTMRTLCKQFKEGVFIAWNGDVSRCRYDFDMKNKLGNITEISLMQILNSPAYIRMIKEHEKLDFKENTMCADCKEWYFSYGEN